MKVISSYRVKILHYNHIFDETVRAYRKAVAFFLDVCHKEWANIEPLRLKERNNHMERLTIRTKRNPNPKYDFNQCCYKMPSYLRRAAIQEALGGLFVLCIQSPELGAEQTKRQRANVNV